MKLNKKTYFTPENKYLSNSKCNDWLKGKEYFYKKHIAHELSSPITDALVTGSAVDTWLTEGKEAFDREYIVVSRRSRKGDVPWRYQLSSTMYDEIVGICEVAEKADAIQALGGHKKQVVLQTDIELGHWKGLCGVLDFLWVDGDDAIITDLKTTKSIVPTKYHYSCLDYGYYRQLAMYGILVEKNFGVKNIVYRHIAIEKNTDKIYKAQTFQISDDRINYERDVLFKIFDDIKAEKEYKDPEVTWDSAITIGEVL